MGNPYFEFVRHDVTETIIRPMTVAKQELNWEPKVQLEEGLLRVIAYFIERE